MARILFFGKLADIAGGRERELKLSSEIRSVGQLIDQIASDDELLGAALRQKSVRYIINEQIEPGDVISDKDEIAFLPPVSGG